ncbi:MAG: hypothetical protein R3F30_11475 [Planctomycetota bacterium]
MRPGLLAALFALTLPAALSAQAAPKDADALRSWAVAVHPGVTAVHHKDLLREARALGWMSNPADSKRFKRLLREATRTRGAGRLLALADPAPTPWQPGALAGAEKEYNDSVAFANDAGVLTTAKTSINGSLNSAEVDSFRFQIVADGTVTFTGSAAGSAPYLEVANAMGDELWGMAWLQGISGTIDLPRGTYVARITGARSPTTYKVDMSWAAKPIPTLAYTGNTQISVGQTVVPVRFVLPADGRVKLALSSTNSADTYLWLVNDRWGYVFDVDDAGATSSDAGLDALLPKGTYYAYIQAFTSTTTTTITATFTAQTIPVLTAGKSATGTCPVGQEFMDTWAIPVGTNEAVTLTVAGSGTNAMPDPYMFVYDQAMGFVLESDDDYNTSDSGITATMPAGVYYVASTSWNSSGSYTVSRKAGTGATTKALPGRNAGSIGGVDTAQTFTFSLLTPTKVEVAIVENTLWDAEVWVIDTKTTRAVTWMDESIDIASCRTGGILPPGDYAVIVKDWNGSNGTFDLVLGMPMQRETGDRVWSWGEEATSSSSSPRPSPSRRSTRCRACATGSC